MSISAAGDRGKSWNIEAHWTLDKVMEILEEFAVDSVQGSVFGLRLLKSSPELKRKWKIVD